MSAIYSPKRTSYVKSDDPLERVYNKKGYRLALINDNSPDFKMALDKFISTLFNSAWEDKSQMKRVLELDNSLVQMCSLDVKILKRWMKGDYHSYKVLKLE